MIIKAKFINHVIIGDADLDFGKVNYIAFKGRNGSGKSMVANLLQPYSISKHWKNSNGQPSYPIKKGKIGLKQLIFLKDGVYYQVTHEYQPNPKTADSHSCKCYISIVNEEFEVTEELNPTGQNHSFQAICREKLKFDTDTFTTAFISIKETGLNDTSGNKRLRLLNTLVDMSRIKLLSGKVNKRLSETNGILKYIKTDFSSLNHLNPTLLEEGIVNNEKKIIELNEKLGIKKEKLKMIEANINKLNTKKYSELEVSKLSEYLNLVTGYNLNTTIGSIRELSVIHKIKEDSLIDLFEKKKSELSRVDNELKILSDTDSLTNMFVELEDRRNNSVNNILKIVLNYEDSPILFKDITDVANNLSIYTNLDISIFDSEVLDNTINGILVNIRKLDAFLDDYNTKHASLSSYGDTKIVLEKTGENCVNCKAFIIFNEYVKFVEDYKEKYSNCLIERDELSAVLELYMNYRDTVRYNTEKLSSIYTRITNKVKDKFDSGTLEAFIYKFLINMRNGTLDNILKFLSEHLNVINSLDIEIAAIAPKIQNNKVSVDALASIRNRRNEINTDIANIQNDIDLEYGKYDVFNKYMNIYTFDSSTIKECFDIVEYEKSRYDKLKKENDNKVFTEKGITEIEQNLVSTNKELVDDKSNLDKIKKTHDEIVKLEREVTVDTRVKKLFEKKIPIDLLFNKLTQIEDRVNEILADNDFIYSIRMIPELDNIRIPIMVGDRETYDVSNLSFGESGIIALLLNAVITDMAGYDILCIDEMDSTSDTINKNKYPELLQYLINNLNIKQIVYISHTSGFMTDMQNSVEVLVGDCSNLGYTIREDALRIKTKN